MKITPKLDLKTMMKHKDDVVTDNTKGIEFLFKKNKITRIDGLGEIVAAGKVKVGKETYEAENIIIATGSDVISLPGITGAKTSKSGVELTVEPAAGGKAEKLKADVVLMAIGRKPYVDGLGLDKVGVALDDRGRIKTDEFFETSVEGIYAIGDVIAGPMLAHKAEDEGVILAEMLSGQSGHIDYDMIPGVVYTWPEVANVGKTEEQLKDAGVKYNAGKFPFMANGRARAMNSTAGFVKILADKETDRILGAHIVGPNAGDLIQEVVSVMEFEGTAEDIGRTCHAHPTLTEVVKEAALAVHKRPLHI